MTTTTAVATACAVAFVAGAVKGASVLGFGLVAAPPLAVLLDPREVLVVLVLPALLMDLAVAFGRRGRGPAPRPAVPMTSLLAGGAGGVGLGVLALDVLDPAALAVGVGSAVLVTTLVGARRWGRDRPRAEVSRRDPLLRTGVGFTAGLTGFFGPPVVSYLQARGLARNELVATAAVAFVWFGVLRLAAMVALGLVTSGLLLVSVLLFVPAAAGFAAGSRLRTRLPEVAFTRVVRSAVLASSVLLIAANLPL